MNRISRQTTMRQAGIVHLGLGAFSRSHIAIYTEDAILKADGDWGIVGVSLRSTKVRDALASQQYVYTAAQLDPERTTCRRVEVISDMLVAPENPSAVLQQMAHPAIKIVSLTVTEKGYCLSPSTGKLDLQHPDIQHDLVNPHPVTAPGFLVRALDARRLAGHLPFTVLSCDNLAENGNVVQRVVTAFAENISLDLLHWIEEHGCFPSSMVDRITPATTLDDRQSVEKLISMDDAAPVMHEPFTQWVIENSFVNNERPDWESVGAQIVSDVRPFELMKLRMLNGTHSALAYLGYLAGFKTIASTVANDDFKAFTELLWDKEIVPSLTAPSGISLSVYAEDLMKRYSNPNVRHLTWQIAMDGSQKLPQRILDTIDERYAKNAQTPGLLLTVAAWMRYVSGIDESGIRIDVRDPLANEFTALAENTTNPEDWVANILAMREVFSDQIAEAISEPVTKTYKHLLEYGAHDMVRGIVQEYRG